MNHWRGYITQGSTTPLSDEFIDWKRALHFQITALDVDYKTWIAINDLLAANSDQFKAAPHFWNSTHRAFIDRLIIGLWAISSDNDGKSASLRRFLVFCRANHDVLFGFTNVQRRVLASRPNSDDDEKRWLTEVVRDNLISATQLTEIADKLASVDDVVVSLRGWRHSVLAHRDRAYLTGERSVSEDFPIKPLEIRATIDVCGDVLSALSSGFDTTELLCGMHTSIPMEIENLA